MCLPRFSDTVLCASHCKRQDWVQDQTKDRDAFKSKLYQLDVLMNERSFDDAKKYVDDLMDVKGIMFTPGRFGTSIVPLPAQSLCK